MIELRRFSSLAFTASVLLANGCAETRQTPDAGAGGLGGGGDATSTGSTSGSTGTTSTKCMGAGCPVWSYRWGDDKKQEVLGAAVGPDGSAFLVIRVSGVVDEAPLELLVGDDEGDAYLVKLDPNGDFVWKVYFPGKGVTDAAAVTVGANEHVYVGVFAEGKGLFVTEVDKQGKSVAVTPIGGEYRCRISDISLVDGGFRIGGHFLGTIDLGGGPVAANPGSSGTKTNGFTAFGKGGTMVSGTTWGNGQTQTVCGARHDSAGNLWVAGTFDGSVDVGGTTLVSKGGNDVYLVRFPASNMNVIDRKILLGDPAEQSCTSFVIDAADNMVVSGQYAGTINVGGTIHVAPVGRSALFAAIYDASGGVKWSRTFAQGTGEVHAAFDSAGNVALAGGFLGTLDLGSASVTNGGEDHGLFVGKLTSQGDALWLRGYTSTGDASFHAVGVNGQGDVIVGGVMEGKLDLDGAMWFGMGGGDAFVAKFTP